ncbi:MAG: fibronectin type III domain-containing protein, partial [Bacteroidales bacterium]|nr:fibronectin type III domain-containing protein [Bacteroidales bacterium]
GTLTALTDEYTHISLPLDESYVEQTIRLAFFAGSEVSGGDNRLVLDNIELLSSECMHPVDVAVAAGATEAVISWSDLSTDNTSGYELVINTGDSLTGDNVRTLSIDAEEYTATVDDLTPRTTYYYFLRSACEEEPTMGSWARGSFRTGCLPIELPYDEDFDIYEEGDTPDCWDIISANSNSSGEFPSVTMDENNGVFYFYGYTSGASGKMVAATPYIPAALNNLEISFDVYSSTSYPLIVYLATDPNDETTYQQIGSYSDITGEETIELSTDTVSGLTFTDADSGYVVFTGTIGNSTYYSSNYTNAYIDNLHIAKMNPCRRVSGVTVSGVTESSATLTWNEVEGAEGYRVLYGTENDVTAATPLNDVTDTTATLSDLSEATKYYVWVYTLCAEQSMSDSRSASFTTKLTPAALPYSTGFEEGDDVAWMMANGTNGWFIGSAASNGGTNGMYISNDNGTTNAYSNSSTTASYAVKLFAFDEGEYTMTFDWRSYGESNYDDYDYLRVFVVPGTMEFTGNDGSNYNSSSTPAGCIASSAVYEDQNTWQSDSLTFNVTTAGNYNVVFYWHNDGSVGENPPAAIDNVSIAAATDPVSIDEVEESADIVLFPNPATSNVTLRGVEAGSQVSVVDMNGRMVRDFQATSNDVRIDVSTLAKGAYFVRVVNEKVNSIQKLIVR